jgi:hypothetical protein
MQLLPRGMQDVQLRLPVLVFSRRKYRQSKQSVRMEFYGFGAPSWRNPRKCPCGNKQKSRGASENELSTTAPVSALPFSPPFRRLPVAAEDKVRFTSSIQLILSNPRSASEWSYFPLAVLVVFSAAAARRATGTATPSAYAGLLLRRLAIFGGIT